MRSGCLNLALVLLATSLTAAGIVLFFSFAAMTYESRMGIETILRTVVALVAAYFFVRVGMSVWRDLRGRRPTVGSGEEEQKERGRVGNGGR